MSEATFPIVGTAIVLLVVLPAAALAARLALGVLDVLERARGLHVHQGIRHALLFGSSVGPVAWLLSAGIHQSETGGAARACAAAHAAGEPCFEAGFFVLTLGAVVAAFGVPRVVREQWLLRSSTSSSARVARRRVADAVKALPSLACIEGRVFVVDEASDAVCTVGVLSPRIVVRTSFVERLDDDALAGVLLHEVEHVRGRDPLRYFLAWWSMAMNPIGRFVLRADLARWLLAREIHCDREAVIAGGEPLALADAIVTAARSSARSSAAPALARSSAAGVALRVELLMAYADRAPERCCRRPSPLFVIAGVLALVALPHAAGTYAFDLLHRVSESVGRAFFGG